MNGLLPSLQSVAGALRVFSQALGAEQANVSNSSTPGYAAVRAVIHPLGMASGVGGDSVVLQSNGSAQADAIVQAATSQASDSQTQAQQLSAINQQFDITGTSGILAAFEQFSSAFARLSVTPGDASVAATALGAAQSVAAAVQSVARSLDSQSQGVRQSVQSTVSQINDLTGKIAQVNAQIRGQAALDPGADATRRSALEQLSSLVGVTVTQNTDGSVNVLAGGTIPLVLGDQAYAINADLSAVPGSQVTSKGGGASPLSLSGTLGGLLDTLNNAIAPILGGNGETGSLNELAASFASTVNSLLQAGETSSGAPGVPIFTYDAANASNTARTLAVDPTVTAAQLAVATTGASASSNGVANQLAGLVSSSDPSNQINGLSALGFYSSIAQSVGQKYSDASNQSSQDQSTLTTAQANQTSAEGVSLDQEAVNITAYQRAWEASAKLIGVLDNLTLDAVNLVGQQDA